MTLRLVDGRSIVSKYRTEKGRKTVEMKMDDEYERFSKRKAISTRSANISHPVFPSQRMKLDTA